MLTRRLFLASAGAAVLATAVPLSALAPLPVIYGDGIHDDSAGLQALFNGEAFRCDGGVAMARYDEGRVFLSGGHFRVAQSITIRPRSQIVGCSFHATDELRGPLLIASPGCDGSVMMNCIISGNGMSEGVRVLSA